MALVMRFGLALEGRAFDGLSALLFGTVAPDFRIEESQDTVRAKLGFGFSAVRRGSARAHLAAAKRRGTRAAGLRHRLATTKTARRPKAVLPAQSFLRAALAMAIEDATQIENAVLAELKA